MSFAAKGYLKGQKSSSRNDREVLDSFTKDTFCRDIGNKVMIYEYALSLRYQLGNLTHGKMRIVIMRKLYKQ